MSARGGYIEGVGVPVRENQKAYTKEQKSFPLGSIPSQEVRPEEAVLVKLSSARDSRDADLRVREIDLALETTPPKKMQEALQAYEAAVSK